MNIAKWLEQEWVNNLITLASIIAAILAWVAKLRWSKEYTDAKNAVIESKEASISEKEEQVKTKQSQIEFLERQIEFFKEQTPQKIREHYKSIQEQLEEIIEKQRQEVVTLMARAESSDENQIKLQKEIKEKEFQIKKLSEDLSIAKALQDSAQRLEPSLSVEFNNRMGYLLSVSSSDDLDEIEEREYYTPYPTEITADSLAEWFLDNYKDPVHGVPYDDGEYVYVYGGPYHADEELFDHFPNTDEAVINAAVEKIEDDGTLDWVKRWQY